jgi:hypothetical protein
LLHRALLRPFGLLTAWASFAGCAASAPTVPLDDAGDAELKREVVAAFEQGCDLRLEYGATPLAATLPPGEAPPAPPPGFAPQGPRVPSVFLEMALFVAPAGMGSGSRDLRPALANEPKARLVATPHQLLDFGQPARMSFEQHSGPLLNTALQSLDSTATPASEGQLALALDVHLLLPTATNPASVAVPATRVRFAVAAPVQTPIVATAAVPGRADEMAVLLLSAYVLRTESDLRTLFECKMRNRQRWVERARR